MARGDELETLLAVQQAITRRLDLDVVLQLIADEARRLTNTRSGGVYLLEEGRLKLAVVTGEADPALVGLLVDLHDSVVGLAVRTRQPVLVRDAAHDPRVNQMALHRSRTQSFIVVPLLSGDKPVGGICVNDKIGSELGPEDERILTLLAGGAVIGVENARLYRESEQAAVAAERSRLARDLHDAVTQTLFSASLIADVLPRLWVRDQPEAERRLQELRQLTRGALAEMRTLLLELRPTALAEAPLGEALRHLAEAATGRGRLPVSLTVTGEATLPPQVQLMLYRVAQEALNNVIRHARASQASLRLELSPASVSLTITDDGCGFDPARVAPGHMGVGIMRERALAVGADFWLQSQPGNGTTIQIRVNLVD